MRTVLAALTAVALFGVGVVVYQQATAEVDELDDCTPGFVEGVPSIEELGLTSWSGPPLALEPVHDIPEALAGVPFETSMLVASRLGGIYRDGQLWWTEPAISVDGQESGLLDVHLHGDFIYTSVTRLDGHLEIRSRPAVNPQPDDYGVMMLVEQPSDVHKSGNMAAAPGGYMFISLGDGGPISDPDGQGQNLDTLLGSILRIDPRRDGYSIPPDNPKVGGKTVAQWAYGVRSPWRISVDGDTLWISDAGNYCFEELNSMPASEVDKPWNFGWSALEGSSRGKGPLPDNLVPPVLEWSRGYGCAAVGGHVYRGAIDELHGLFVFTDYCGGKLLAFDGDVVYDLGVEAAVPTSLAEIANGELWIMSQTEGVLALTARD